MQSFDMFQSGGIKGQNLTSKQLMTIPEIKQTQFQCLLPLSEDTQKQLLSQIIAHDLSLKELKKKCEKEKKLADLREKFVHLTNSKSWRDAVVRFPIHTKDDKLQQFFSLDFMKSTPQAFSQFCAEAVLCTAEPDESTVTISEINKCTFVEVANLSSLNPSVVSSKLKTGGSHFFSVLIRYVSTAC